MSQGASCAIQSAEQIQKEAERVSSDLSEILLEQSRSETPIGKKISDSLRKWVSLKRCCENIEIWSHSCELLHKESVNKIVKNIKVNLKRLELCLKIHQGSREVIAGFEETFYKYLVEIEEDLRSFSSELKTELGKSNNQ